MDSSANENSKAESKSKSPLASPLSNIKSEYEKEGSPTPATKAESADVTDVESTEPKKVQQESQSKLIVKMESNESSEATFAHGRTSRPSSAYTTGTGTASSSSSAAPTPEPVLTTSAGADADQTADAMASYEIKWNNYASVLQNVFRKVLISHQFSDVTLACEGESIKCHRILLAACSSYFEKLLNDNQDNKLVIYMKDMKVWELKALVNFMYNGQVSVEEAQLPNFMKAAEALNISGLDGAGSSSGVNTGAAEARTVSESTVPAKIISTFKRPSLSSDNNYTTQAVVKRPITNAQVRPVPALQAQPRLGVHDGVKRKMLLSNMHGGPPKLVRMQQVRSNGVNNLGMRSNAWRGIGVLKSSQNGGGTNTQRLGQVVAYENEDYQEDDELDQPDIGGDDSQGLQGVGDDEGTTDSGQAAAQGNGQLENGDDDEELEDGNELKQYEDEDDTFNDGGMLNVYGLEGNQDDEQFEDDEEAPYDGDEGEDGMMVINEAAPLPRTRNGRSYAPELQEAAFDALRNGVSIRQCSELYGIPRKTLGKWKNRGLHLQPSTLPKAQVLDINSAMPKKRGPAIGSTLTGPEGVDRARRLQKATKMAMSGITVRQAAAHFDIPRTTLCAYMKRQGLASQARNMNNAKAQYLQQQQQHRRVGSTTITLSRNGTTGGNYRLANNNAVAAGGRLQQQAVPAQEMDNDEEDEIPFLGLSDFIDQNSDNWETAN